MNQGDTTFCNASSQAGTALSELRVSRGAAFGDLDNDGNIDIVVGDLDNAPMILKNEGDKSNHWVTLELGAKQGNPLAIGARIKDHDRKDRPNRRDQKRRKLFVTK